MTFSETLRPSLARLALTLSADQFDRFDRLGTLMLEDPLYPSVSKIKEPGEIVAKHFLDSLAPLSLDLPFWAAGGDLLDLGTGGGFPAIPLAIALPNWRVHAVDAKGKAVDFVTRMRDGLGLDNLLPRQSRAEEIGRDPAFRGKMDLVVSRALSAVRVLVELCLPLVRVGGRALFYKGPQLAEELNEAGNALRQLLVAPNAIRCFTMGAPLLPFERGYLLIEQKNPGPVTFPRRNGVPTADPL